MSTNGTAMSRQRDRVAAPAACRRRSVAQPAGHDQTGDRERDDPARRHVAIAIVAGRRRARRGDSVLTSPPTTGLASLASVQIAATPMAPAPMKRTCCRQIVGVRGEIDAGRRRLQVGEDRHAAAQAISSPVSMAMPTDRPTRWPAPKSASDHAML